MNVRWLLSMAALVLFLPACAKQAADSTPKSDAEPAPDAATAAADADDAGTEAEAPASKTAGDRLLAAMVEEPPQRATSSGQRMQPSPNRENPIALAFEFNEALSRDDEDAKRIAGELLAVTQEAIAGKGVADYIDRVAKESPTAAAKLLVWAARAQMIAKHIPKRPNQTSPATYAVGRLIIADGKFSPADVMFQVPITEEGYFATEIGDVSRPLAFRAPGYEPLDAPFPNVESRSADPDSLVPADVVYPILLENITIKPLADDQRATLRGRAAVDDASKAATAKVSLSLGMGPANTPHGGYSPRKSWPQPLVVEVAEDGTFEAPGLNPSEYSVSISADEHAPVRETIALKSGETHDAGDLKLRSTNLGFYVGADEPDVPELEWEKDFDAALERAKKEDRPLFIMMTATWCGPCKMLERDSLANVWIREFMKPFVVVQAFEDKAVEDKYGCEGYPTLVFCDPQGEPLHKFVGYRPAINFAGEVAKAYGKVDAEMPAELQTLIDKEVVTLD